MAVPLSHQAVPEAISGNGELDWHVGDPLEAVKLTSLLEDPVDNSGLSQPLHEVVQNHPLIVPSHYLARLGEQVSRRVRAVRQHVNDLVVKLQKRQVGLCDNQVLV